MIHHQAVPAVLFSLSSPLHPDWLFSGFVSVREAAVAVIFGAISDRFRRR